MSDSKSSDYKVGGITFDQLQEKAKALHKQIDEIPNPYALHLFDIMADFFGAEEALKFHNVFKKQYGLIGMPRSKVPGLSMEETKSNGFVLYCLKNLLTMTPMPPKPTAVPTSASTSSSSSECSLDAVTTRSPLPGDEKKSS